MNKQKGIIAFILIALVLVSTACINTRHYVHKYSIRTSYKEWIDQIGIFSYDNLKVSGYREENNKIELELEYENGITGYKELCDVVNAHNKFVDKNPDYFPSDIDIHIYNMKNFNGSGYAMSSFYNQPSDGLCDYSALGRKNTAKLQYMLVDMLMAEVELEKSDEVIIEVPVIIMECRNEEYTPEKTSYEFLSGIKNIEQIVLDFWEPEYDKKYGVYDSIRAYVPNVELYEQVHLRYQDYLKKIE